MIEDSSTGSAFSSVNPLTPTVRPTAFNSPPGIFKMLPIREQEDIDVRITAEAIKQMDFIMEWNELRVSVRKQRHASMSNYSPTKREMANRRPLALSNVS